MKQKTLKVEYFLLPRDRSHIQQLMYRLCISESPEWKLWVTTVHEIETKGIERIFEQYLDLWECFKVYSKSYNKVKAYECKLVRKR